MPKGKKTDNLIFALVPRCRAQLLIQRAKRLLNDSIQYERVFQDPCRCHLSLPQELLDPHFACYDVVETLFHALKSLLATFGIVSRRGTRPSCIDGKKKGPDFCSLS